MFARVRADARRAQRHRESGDREDAHQHAGRDIRRLEADALGRAHQIGERADGSHRVGRRDPGDLRPLRCRRQCEREQDRACDAGGRGE